MKHEVTIRISEDTDLLIQMNGQLIEVVEVKHVPQMVAAICRWLSKNASGGVEA